MFLNLSDAVSSSMSHTHIAGKDVKNSTDQTLVPKIAFKVPFEGCLGSKSQFICCQKYVALSTGIII